MNTETDFSIFADDDRVDGFDKVTGKAKYSADYKPDKMAYGLFVTSTIAKGSVKAFNLAAAKKSPGVIEIITYMNCPRLPGYYPFDKDPNKKGFEWGGLKVFQNDQVYHYGQAIALVVASTWEKALKAAALVKVDYEAAASETDIQTLRKDAAHLKPAGEYKRGEPDAYKNADVFIEQEYFLPNETHNPIELHATLAQWEGADKLLVYDKSQGPKGTQSQLAGLFGLPPENVRVVTKFLGGAFGSALRSWPHVAAACIAAKMTGQPVRVQLTRRQMSSMVGYRPASWQQVGMGASKDGKLTGITHHAISLSARLQEYREGIVNISQYLYDCPNMNSSYKTLPLDVSIPTWMRGPGETSGAFALECAMDELSYKLGIDPVELRIINHATLNPQNKLPWSSKFLKECYDKGREMIGWQNRPVKPRSLTTNGKLIGYGMGGGAFGAHRGNATAKAVFTSAGELRLYSAVSDMGPGTATTMVAIASRIIPIPVSQIHFLLGDTDFPNGPTQGGSATTATMGSGVTAVCEALKSFLTDTALKYVPEFNGLTAADLLMQDGSLVSKNDASKKIRLVELVKLTGKPELEFMKESGPDYAEMRKYAMNSFSAHFVKVAVDANNGTIELKQVVCTGDGGKIMNMKGALSQMIGGAVGGIGMALTEEALIDPLTGKWTNDSFGSYLVPKQLNVPKIECWFPDKPDFVIDKMGAKGVGEIALIGFASAVANAVYNATGKRVRSMPIKAGDLV